MSEQGDRARKALHDMRWGPHIEDVIDRQQAMDDAIKTALSAVNYLESTVDALMEVARFTNDHDDCTACRTALDALPPEIKEAFEVKEIA